LKTQTASNTVFPASSAWSSSRRGVEAMVAQQFNALAAARRSRRVRQTVKLFSIAADEPSAPSIVAADRHIEETIERSGIA
jgi:hypothetical protein